MSGKHAKGRPKKKTEHDSWLSALWSLLVDTVFSFPKSGSEAGEEVSVFDASDKLGKKGRHRQGILIFVGWLVFCAAMTALCASMIGPDNREAWIGAAVFAGLGIAAVIFRRIFFDSREK